MIEAHDFAARAQGAPSERRRKGLHQRTFGKLDLHIPACRFALRREGAGPTVVVDAGVGPVGCKGFFEVVPATERVIVA